MRLLHPVDYYAVTGQLLVRLDMGVAMKPSKVENSGGLHIIMSSDLQPSPGTMAAKYYAQINVRMGEENVATIDIAASLDEPTVTIETDVRGDKRGRVWTAQA